MQVTPADGAFLSPIEPINKCNIYLDLRERNYGKSTIGYGPEPDEPARGENALKIRRGVNAIGLREVNLLRVVASVRCVRDS